MNQKRLFFKPDQVDEQVDQFSLNLPGERATGQKQAQEPVQKDEKRAHPGEQTELQQDMSTRLVQELQAYYQVEFQHHRDVLEHAWWRIAAYQPASHVSTQAEDAVSSSPPLTFSSERIHLVQNQETTEHSRGRKITRRMNLFAATLVAVVLVGMLVTALTLSRTHQKSTVGAGKTPTAANVPTATPTPLPVGAVVHTQLPPAGMRSYNLTWSPDSTRVASLVNSQDGTKNQLQIWDATTGGHLLTVPFAQGFNEIHWSPTGKYLALANLQTIVIVDSQIGSIVKTFTTSLALNQGSPATSTVPLSSLFPLGGGYGFFSVAWTPDGSSLAVAVSSFTSEQVELLDPVTGAVKTTLFSPYGQAGGLSFSSDGQYLAASNDQQVTVWQVSSRSIIFQKNPGQSTSIAWQPQTHDLAILLLFPDNLQLWNIDAQKVVKTYPGVGVFTWSPDGKEVAIRAFPGIRSSTPTTPSHTSSKVVILDAASGTPVATYKSQETSVFFLAWSPNSRYIATIEWNLSSTLIRVWIA